MAGERSRAEQKARSIFDLPPGFFDSCRLLRSHPSEILPAIQSLPPPPPPSSESGDASANGGGGDEELDPKGDEGRGKEAGRRWTCNTCKAEFDSLQDQRSHFKSDVHRLNVKLSIAGKNIVKEEDFYELGGDSLLEDIDVSSISGSEDELEMGSTPNTGISGKEREGMKQKLYLSLHSGDTVSVWRCLIFDESEELLLENSELNHVVNAGGMSYVEEADLISRLKCLVREPRDKTQLRIVLLASGGHFAGCIFDGNSIIAHKTFHRYVVRAKAGKKQSSKDATGKAGNSAGSSLRRYNEAALRKEIQELLVTWKPYIDSSLCIFIYAPSKNRQLLFDGEKPPCSVVRHVPLTVRRPTLKEAKRIYNHMTHLTYEVHEKACLEGESRLYTCNEGKCNKIGEHMEIKESSSGSGSGTECLLSNEGKISLPSDGNEVTPLHEAAKSGDAQRTLELLEQGLNPCIKDSRGRTPYMLATEKEVRNTFRRFMALNLDTWDWNAANVPSPLTKEMEDSQATKQAEKDAKRKAKAKELKRLRKAKEKTKAQAAASENISPAVPQGQAAAPAPALKQQPQLGGGLTISTEEEQRRALAAEREKRAAAAEKRMSALNLRPSTATTSAAAAQPPPPSSSEPRGGGSGVSCSCCNASLAGKVPFHRYHYQYCSTSCMYVHKQMLEEDG